MLVITSNTLHQRYIIRKTLISSKKQVTNTTKHYETDVNSFYNN